MLQFLASGEHLPLGPLRRRQLRRAIEAISSPFGLLRDKDVLPALEAADRFERGEGTAEERQAAASAAAAEGCRQAAILRDLFGPLPFRRVSVDPAWLAANAGAVRHLVGAVRDGHTFELLPILADALQDAGCFQPDLLAHCRGPGPHFPGCWVIDLLAEAAWPASARP